MKLPAVLAKQNPITLAIGASIVLIVVYYIGKQAIGATAKTAGGIFSGRNELTKGTVYDGTGIAGTLGAATNAASGGVLERIGSRIGGAIYDATH